MLNVKTLWCGWALPFNAGWTHMNASGLVIALSLHPLM